MGNLYTFIDGTTANPNQVNTNTEFILKSTLSLAENGSYANGAIQYYAPNSAIVTGSTTAIPLTISGATRYLPSGSPYDRFTSGTIDTVRYTFSPVGGVSTGSAISTGNLSCTGYSETYTLTRGKITINKDFGAYPGSTVVLINCAGSVTWTAAASAGGAYLQYGGITIASDVLDLTGAGTDSYGGSFYCIKSADLGSWTVYLDGTLLGTTNCSGSTNGTFSIYAQATDGDPTTAIARLHQINVNPPVGGSSYTDSIYYYDSEITSSNIGSGVLATPKITEEFGSMTKVFAVSANNGVAWTTIGSVSTLTTITTANTGSILFKYQYNLGSTLGFFQNKGLKYVVY
jgi:hypothetical protein